MVDVTLIGYSVEERVPVVEIEVALESGPVSFFSTF